MAESIFEVSLTLQTLIQLSSLLLQILSYSVEDNLRPKVKYLLEELGFSVAMLIAHPAFFSYSLDKEDKAKASVPCERGQGPCLTISKAMACAHR